MISPEADKAEREFVERAKAWHLELLKAKEQDVVKIPEYERGA